MSDYNVGELVSDFLSERFKPNSKVTVKRGERVELRGFGIFSTNIQKARISRNPKTGEKVNTPQKKTIHFKMSKDLFKKLNNEKE